MSEKRKGCGFLIAAIVATVIATIIAYMGIKSGVTDIQNTTENTIDGAITFNTPETATFTATLDEEVSVWLNSNDSTPPTKPNGYSVKATTADGTEVAVSQSADITIINNQVQIASFPASKGNTYAVSVSGLPEDSIIEVSHSSLSEIMGGAAKAAGSLLGAIALGFIAFILGLIGLIRWLTSKPKDPAPIAQG